MAPSNAENGGSAAGQGGKNGKKKDESRKAVVRTPEMKLKAKEYARECRTGDKEQRGRLDNLLKNRFPRRYRAYQKYKKNRVRKCLTSAGIALKEAIDALEEASRESLGDGDEDEDEDGEDDDVTKSDGDDHHNEDDDEDEAPAVGQAITV
ncbi:uncharacterized protein AB675_8246 [Cyphellophora attinorum]|uniref:Uncharacterized protein n=1 Tax=Cyphellophora attinorum TaxID=1664694 RepID=A0A0N1HWK0_9EURO|nr:uncharacterized protein AB675_8246 [Phialophora attinorum]KPI44600.1 hypothetical protein AB675_8246 [Phialophora attinorum]